MTLATIPRPMLTFVVCSAACGSSDLTRLETEQRALEMEVATLRETVGDLRGEMQRKGVIKAGPDGARPKAAGAIAPQTDLATDFPLRASRSETDLAVAFVSEPERRADTPCGWRVNVQHLEPIADFELPKDGLGRASPLEAKVGAHVLTPHVPPARYADVCEGAFRHQSKYLFYSPPEGGDGSQLSVSLSGELPLPDELGRPRYWVYPGTTLTVEMSKPWNEAEWGPANLVFHLNLRDVGLPTKPQARSTGAVSIALPDRELSGRDASWRGSELLSGAGPWTVSITSPADGPFILVEALAVGNEGHAAVLTSKQHDGGGE